MHLDSDSFKDGTTIPDRYAFGKPHPETHFTFSGNINPHLRWTEIPDGTKSFALICHDPDVPSVGDDVNQEGKTVDRDLPRVDFFHWVLVDIPVDVNEIQEGSHSNTVTKRGKDPGEAPVGRQGLNNYTQWFAGDDDMSGQYAGYDGPAPPWNDLRVHNYIFTVYALNVDSLDLDEPFDGKSARGALAGHVLDKARIRGTYTMNPRLRGTRKDRPG